MVLTPLGYISYGVQLCVRMYSTHPAFPDGGSWREHFCRGRDVCKTWRFRQPDHCALLQFRGLVSNLNSGTSVTDYIDCVLYKQQGVTLAKPPDTVALWGPSLPLGDFWALANQYCNPGNFCTVSLGQ